MPDFISSVKSAGGIINRPNGPTLMGAPQRTINLFSKESATGTKYVPLTAADWIKLGCAVPQNTWLCQEASGNLAAFTAPELTASSLNAFTLVASGTPSYAQAVTGWTRTAVKMTEVLNQGFTTNGTGSLGNPTTRSLAMGLYFQCTGTPGGTRLIMGNTDTANTSLLVTIDATGALTLKCATVSTTTTSTAFADGNMHAALVVYDRIGSTCSLFTDLENITVTYAAIVNGQKGYGAAVAAGFTSAPILMPFAFYGVDTADLTPMYNAGLLTRLGW